MKMNKKIIALTAILIGMIGWAGDSAPFLLDTTDQLVATGGEVSFSYNSSWIGGDPSAEVVISADGTEINRTTGEGEFAWSPTNAGKHTLTYTTFINGVVQEEVYTATVFTDWRYTVEDGKATIVETTQKSGNVTIPSEIDGYPVVGFMDGLFDGCTNLTQVVIPGNLVAKMSDMFPSSYDKLTTITLTGDVTEIPQDAFARCEALESFVIPDGTTTIGMYAFDGCSTLTDIVIPDSVYSIGLNAFANCTDLTNVSMPFPLKEQVESENVFVGCSENLEIVYRTAEIKNVVAKQRFPWNGKVDIKFEVVGNVNAGLSSENPAELIVSAKDSVTGGEWIAKMLTGDTGTDQGEHHVVWDMKADGLSFYSSNIQFKVGYSSKPRKYCVIDLSAGKDATNYLVSYLDAVPEGGWTDEHKTMKLVLRLIEPGSFKMGGSYDVTLTKPYYMGVFEVTQKQYELVTGNKPSDLSGDTLPVEKVSWNTIRGNSSTHNWPTIKTVDPNSFIGRLQARTGLSFDLPTEAQWEYACRAGTTTTYYWGNSMDGAYAWYRGNSSSKTHIVGTRTPNAWGLYDMSGNVREWCLDWYAGLSSSENLEGPLSGSYRVGHGGGWASSASACTSAFRIDIDPSSVNSINGFRVAGQSLRNRVVDVFYEGESSSIFVDTYPEPLFEMGVDKLSYNSSWVGGDLSAEVVISADGAEIKRTRGEGEFIWSPTTAGKHTLTYTTYINGVEQEEVYTATVFTDWKYTVTDGKATIVETTQKSGSVTIPSEIDGYPVVGLDEGLFKGCEGLTSIVIPDSITVIKGQCLYDLTQNAWVILYDESDDETIVYKSNDISHNGSTYMTMTVEGPLELSFDWKVSSESGWDYLKWYLDGTEKSEISGTGSDWQTVNISIPTGEHTIKWHYSKDDRYDNGEDCGWVRLPSDVTVLRSDAFEGCLSITNITLEGAVSALPIDIINQCSSLESLKLSQTSLEVRLKDKNKWEAIENGVFKSATIGDGESSTMEARVFGSGKFTFKWKASSEYYEDEIYDYATLKVDGDEVDTIGGHTSWRDVEIELIGAKEHVISWVYKKDALDEDNVGDDCVWVTSIKFRPERTVAFDVGTADGVAPLPITINAESIVKLPAYQGFDFPKYTLTGWNDGLRMFSPGADYTVPLTNVVLTAVYEPNTLSEPVIYTRDVTNGGVLEKEATSITLLGDEGCKIYYTIDGSEPSSQSMLYTSAFSVDKLGDVVIKAIAIKENYFDSAITTFSYRRRAYSPEECLNNSYFNTSSGGNKAWYRVIEEEAHDGDAALRSGIINDNETSSISIVVEGEGSVSFWWKTSSEINRGNKYDYVSFMVDDVEQKWMGGITDWSNIVCQVSGQGSHTLRWVYQKNGNGVSKGEDCAWLDEVVWMPAGAIPELETGASSEMITLVLSGAVDAKLAANIKDAAEYAAFRAWTMGLSGVTPQQVKDSAYSWLSYALDTDALIAAAPKEGDLTIGGFTQGSSAGVFDLSVSISGITVGDNAVAANLKKVFDVEGAGLLDDSEFKEENVDIEFDKPEGGKVKIKATPKDPTAKQFFMRVKMKQ